MSKPTYEKVASEESETTPTASLSSPTIVVSTPTSPSGNSIQFAKAAFAFRDRLDDVRKKHNSVTTTVKEVQPGTAPVSNVLSTQLTEPAEPADKAEEDPVIGRRLRILRLLQNTLTALLSIAIAALQGKAYLAFQRTKDMPGAWPSHPNVLPTLLLMGVAIGASIFDLSLLVAYLFPSVAKRAFRIATSSHAYLTTIKGVSYALTSVVCKGGFDYGNSAGNNSDLWGWTCSAAADAMDSVTQASANCEGQTAAWYIALIQIGIEGLGVVGGFLVKQRGNPDGKKVINNDLEARFQEYTGYGKEIDETLGGITPKFEYKPDVKAS